MSGLNMTPQLLVSLKNELPQGAEENAENKLQVIMTALDGTTSKTLLNPQQPISIDLGGLTSITVERFLKKVEDQLETVPAPHPQDEVFPAGEKDVRDAEAAAQAEEEKQLDPESLELDSRHTIDGEEFVVALMPDNTKGFMPAEQYDALPQVSDQSPSETPAPAGPAEATVSVEDEGKQPENA